MIFSAWRTGAKLLWDVPRSTHTYFVQEVLTPNIQSLELRILRNFVGFFQSLLCSPSTEISVLARLSARDIRSSLGKNLKIIRDITGLDPWIASKKHLRSALELGLQTPVPEVDFWRTKYLAKLLAERSEAHYRADEEEVCRLSSLMESLVTN